MMATMAVHFAVLMAMSFVAPSYCLVQGKLPGDNQTGAEISLPAVEESVATAAPESPVQAVQEPAATPADVPALQESIEDPVAEVPEGAAGAVDVAKPSAGGLGSVAQVSMTQALASSKGYSFAATTTRYGQTPATACGGVNTVELVKGTGYIVVASAQSMQSQFPISNCKWECRNAIGMLVDSCPHTSCGSGGRPVAGCTCRQTGMCYCGKAEGAGAGGTAAMGCFTCARGRFLKKRPYMAGPDDESFQTPEIKVVVADVCPYGSNTAWCPAKPGDVNACGEKNHFDFTSYPEGIDNHYFVFSPEPCPEILQSRMAPSMGRCQR